MSTTAIRQRRGCAAIAAAALLAMTAAEARAQQEPPDLSGAAVEDFFETLRQDAERMVRAGDFQGLTGWAENSIAEEATFFVSETFHDGDRYKGSAVLTMDKQDMLALSRAVAGMMPAASETLQDYTLEIAVTDVVPIGPNAATATVRFVERGSFLLSGGAPGPTTVGDEAAAKTGGATIELEATALCHHLIRRDEEGDRLLLGMTSCHADIRF